MGHSIESGQALAFTEMTNAVAMLNCCGHVVMLLPATFDVSGSPTSLVLCVCYSPNLHAIPMVPSSHAIPSYMVFLWCLAHAIPMVPSSHARVLSCLA